MHLDLVWGLILQTGMALLHSYVVFLLLNTVVSD